MAMGPKLDLSSAAAALRLAQTAAAEGRNHAAHRNWREAVLSSETSVENYRKVLRLPASSGADLLRRQAAFALNQLATFVLKEGHGTKTQDGASDEAVQLFRLLAANEPSERATLELAIALRVDGEHRLRLRQHDAADAAAGEAAALCRELTTTDELVVLTVLGEVYRLRARIAAADGALERALDFDEAALGAARRLVAADAPDGARHLAEALNAISGRQRLLGRAGESLASAREAVALRASDVDPEPSHSARTLANLAEALAANQQCFTALVVAQSAVAFCLRRQQGDWSRLRDELELARRAHGEAAMQLTAGTITTSAPAPTTPGCAAYLAVAPNLLPPLVVADRTLNRPEEPMSMIEPSAAAGTRLSDDVQAALDAQRSGDVDRAVPLLEQALARGEWAAAELLGAIAFRAGDQDRALETCRAGAEAGHLGSIVLFASLLANRHDFALAAHWWDRAAEIALQWEEVEVVESEGGDDAPAEASDVATVPLRIFVSRAGELAMASEGRTYAAAALQALVDLGHVPVEESFWTAAEGDAEVICADVLRTCDIYVGLIGYDYGTPVRSDPSRSYTELEFDLAADLGVRRLVFVIEDPDLRDNPGLARESRERQAAFRTRIDGAGLIHTPVATVDDLEIKLGQALTGLQRVATVEPRGELFVARNAEALPAMPSEVRGYTPSGAVVRETIALTADRARYPSELPWRMGGGGLGFWTLRWRCEHPDANVAVRSLSAFPSDDGYDLADLGLVEGSAVPGGHCGYVSGRIVERPVFWLRDGPTHSNVVDIEVEWQFWEPHG